MMMTIISLIDLTGIPVSIIDQTVLYREMAG